MGPKSLLASSAAIVALGILYFEFRGRSSNEQVDNSTRWFVDADSGKPFRKNLELGMSVPIKSPFTGHNTGYPAELCYWTADGKAKTDPTPVLLNSEIGVDEPTFCPDCGRLVVGHNPAPDGIHGPPPTKQEYTSRQTAGY